MSRENHNEAVLKGNSSSAASPLTVVIASSNKGKISEINAIFSGLGCEVKSIYDVFDSVSDVEETGQTFEENALLKIRHLPDHPNYIYLSDDSGLEIAALNGAPGIYSARYAGTGATSEQLCQKVLTELQTISDRAAQFRSVIALKFPGGRLETCNGIVKGHITRHMAGTGGFGYDPVFIPEGKTITFAQMPAAEKNRISHRYRALKKAQALIEAYLAN